MQNINIDNYEAYLLDFSEGNLTGELQVELELFLIQHPELEISLDELVLMTLENEATSFSNKNSLKKSESDLVSETQFIAYIEHQLPENECLELEKSCAANPTLAKELRLYVSAFVSADASIVFKNKQSLKRKPKVIWFNFSATQYAAAACVVFLIGLFMLWPKTNINSGNSTLANKTDVATTHTVASNSNKVIESTIKINHVIAPKKTDNYSTQQPSSTKKEQPLLANNVSLKEPNVSVLRDTLHHTINKSLVTESPKNETLIALNVAPVVRPKTIVQVITETDDEPVAINTEKKKKGIWATASRALKNLNHAGVKTVNGDEENNTNNTAYAITLGGISITHKAGL